MMKASQIRAGRGLVGIGQKELADMADLSVATLRRMESDDIGPERSSAGAVDSIRRALEAQGVCFADEGEAIAGPGVYLRPKAP